MLTKQKLNQIRTDLEDVLKYIKDKHNMDIKIGIMHYTNNTFNCKLEAAIGENGTAPDLARAEWNKYAYQFGFSKEDFGMPFEIDNGKHFTISGIKPRSTKYPIVALCAEDGREYKLTASAVKKGIANLKQEAETFEQERM